MNPQTLAQVFEIIMLVLFGVSWPNNIIKAVRSKTAKGVSVVFYYLVMLGYVAGVVAKIVGGNVNYVLAFYCIDIAMVLVATVLYYRNRKLDKMRAALAATDQNEMT